MVEFIVRFSVTILSQPLNVTMVSLYVPEAFNKVPLKLYELQVVTFSVLFMALEIVRFNVATLSHPLDAVNVSL